MRITNLSNNRSRVKNFGVKICIISDDALRQIAIYKAFSVSNNSKFDLLEKFNTEEVLNVY